MIPALLLLAGVACLLPVATAAKEPEICRLHPAWTANGQNPMAKARQDGNMTVLAILKADCGYCLIQATLLQRLKKKLERKGMRNITYMIINMKGSESQKYRLDRVVDFKVYQDNNGDIVDKLGGSKDDFYVYDSCGRLGYYLHHSITYLGWPHVSNAVLYTHQQRHGCVGACPTEKPKANQSSSSEEKIAVNKASDSK